jgi:hypothetical protein
MFEHLNLSGLKLNPKQSLSAAAKLFDIFFKQPNKERLHIVVRPPHTGELFVGLPPIS